MPRALHQTDRRLALRRPVALAARIRIARDVYVPCQVRDISPMGAGLELDFDAFVPLQFRLQIPDDLFEAECALRHRHGDVIGVEFLDARAEAMARYG